MIEIYFNFPILNCDYETEYSCAESGCNDVCRCRKITDIEIVSDKINVTIDCIIVYKNKQVYLPTTIEQYCFARLMSIYKMFDINNYFVPAEGDYYGDILGETTFCKESQLKHGIKHILEISDIDKIKFVLKKEYSYLLKSLNKCHSLEIVTVTIEELRKNEKYFDELKHSNKTFTDFYGNHKLPLGIVHNNRLIDGYHRSVKAGKEGKYIELK